MTPLRVLHVTPYYEWAWAYGGIPRAVAPLVRGLAARGHTVAVWTTDAARPDGRLGGGQLTQAPHRPLSVRIFPNLSNHAAYHWQFFLPRGFRRALRADLRDFDIVHLHACHNVLTALAARECIRAGVPYILQPHGTALRIERRALLKWCFDVTLGRGVTAGAAAVIAVSESERAQISRGSATLPSRVVTVANAVDLDEFQPPPARGSFRRAYGLDDDEIVLYLGKLTPRKLPEVLVQAVSSLRRSRLKLVVAGPDMGAGHLLRDAVGRLGMQQQVLVVGVLEARRRLEALIDADVVAYATKDEAFGLVPIEAILCGTPVVVGDDSGAGEIIRRVGGGMLVRPGDVHALASAIGAVLDAEEEWRRRAERAQREIRRVFSPDVVCGEMERLYDTVRVELMASPRRALKRAIAT